MSSEFTCEVLMTFYQLSFLEFDEIYSKQFYPHKDFSFWPNTEINLILLVAKLTDSTFEKKKILMESWGYAWPGLTV